MAITPKRFYGLPDPGQSFNIWGATLNQALNQVDTDVDSILNTLSDISLHFDSVETNLDELEAEDIVLDGKISNLGIILTQKEQVLYNTIAAEVLNRISGDQVLQSNIEAEAVLRITGDQYLDSRIDYVESLANTALVSLQNVVTVTEDYQVLIENSMILCNAASAPIVVTLVDPSTAIGKTLTIKKIDSSVNIVSIEGYDSETIDGALTFDLEGQYYTLTLITDGTNWFIMHSSPSIFG